MNNKENDDKHLDIGESEPPYRTENDINSGENAGKIISRKNYISSIIGIIITYAVLLIVKYQFGEDITTTAVVLSIIYSVVIFVLTYRRIKDVGIDNTIIIVIIFILCSIVPILFFVLILALMFVPKGAASTWARSESEMLEKALTNLQHLRTVGHISEKEHDKIRTSVVNRYGQDKWKVRSIYSEHELNKLTAELDKIKKLLNNDVLSQSEYENLRSVAIEKYLI
jgi:uncharacterized membrane protein YhaH (DUF805 family)